MGLVNATPRPLNPQEWDPVPIVQEAEWAPGLVWTSVENLAYTGIRFPDRPAHDWAIAAHAKTGHEQKTPPLSDARTKR
jgi:hypothetical protein